MKSMLSKVGLLLLVGIVIASGMIALHNFGRESEPSRTNSLVSGIIGESRGTIGTNEFEISVGSVQQADLVFTGEGMDPFDEFYTDPFYVANEIWQVKWSVVPSEEKYTSSFAVYTEDKQHQFFRADTTDESGVTGGSSYIYGSGNFVIEVSFTWNIDSWRVEVIRSPEISVIELPTIFSGACDTQTLPFQV
jgi:hypothetical protein